jgi:hypothetical protein
MTYWTPRTDSPICTCGGGACTQKLDCRRFLERKSVEHAEKYPQPPYKHQRAIGADGRPLNETVQVCSEFLPREPA